MIQVKVVIGYFMANFFEDRDLELYFTEDLKKLPEQTNIYPCVYYNYLGQKTIKFFNVSILAYNSKNKLLSGEINLKITGPISWKENNLKDKKNLFELLPKGTTKIEIKKVSLTFCNNKTQNILGKDLAVYDENVKPSYSTKRNFLSSLYSSIYTKICKS